jgi:hypothetical protein
VACDDTFAPKQYCNFFRLPRVKVHVVETLDGTYAASYVLERLLHFEHEEDDELWMLLDTDHHVRGTHLKSFVEALREARRQGVNIALSKPSFELWLLLHRVEETALSVLPTARDVVEALRARLGEYNKTNLKQQHYPPGSVYHARLRAARLDAAVTGGDIPAENTTRVYLLWQAILAKVNPRQLPPELRRLVR